MGRTEVSQAITDHAQISRFRCQPPERDGEAMPIDSRSSENLLRRRLASSPAMEVTLLNLSAERCCILAKYGFAPQAGSIGQLYHDGSCIRVRVVWSEAELAALAFDKQLSEAKYNGLAAVFLQWQSIAIGNPHSSKRDLTLLVSPELKLARWARFGALPPRSRCILDLSRDEALEHSARNIELI